MSTLVNRIAQASLEVMGDKENNKVALAVEISIHYFVFHMFHTMILNRSCNKIVS